MENWGKRYLKGRARKVKPRIRRRFAKCKTTLIKINYQARTIRITLRQGEYPSISWKSTWFEHRVRDWIVGEAIIFDDRVVIPFKALRRSMLGELLAGIVTSHHWMATSLYRFYTCRSKVSPGHEDHL